MKKFRIQRWQNHAYRTVAEARTWGQALLLVSLGWVRQDCKVRVLDTAGQTLLKVG